MYLIELSRYNTYVIARYNWDDGSKMHFSKEAKGFEPENLELSYFVEKPALPNKDVKNEIECALGLFVTNMATDADQQGKKASLRNMVSYLFQHQNLMASKFALFYRFSDFYKRKDVIDQFPFFAGIIIYSHYKSIKIRKVGYFAFWYCTTSTAQAIINYLN